MDVKGKEENNGELRKDGTMEKVKNQLSLEAIERWLKIDNWAIRVAAMNACKGRDVPLELIERGFNDDDWRVRQAAMNACQGRDVPLDIIERGLKDDYCDVRKAAMNACQGRDDIPLDVIECWLKDDDYKVRQAAMDVCQGRDVPLDVIERGFNDDDWRVRQAAMNACKDRDVSMPLIRTIEPPETVYKKCLGDVIVCAKIPDDAQVRRSASGKCRTDKAVIIEVIGTFFGEPVGISLHDKTTLYYAGDEVIIEDFDYSDEECSTGFHFFCTKEEAENYQY